MAEETIYVNVLVADFQDLVRRVEVLEHQMLQHHGRLGPQTPGPSDDPITKDQILERAKRILEDARIRSFGCLASSGSPGSPDPSTPSSIVPQVADAAQVPRSHQPFEYDADDQVERKKIAGIVGVLVDQIHKLDLDPNNGELTEIPPKVAPPVDRSQRILTTGKPVPEDYSHTQLDSTGQQKAYVVLTEEERHKGFVRPVRRSYKHIGDKGCGSVTTMGLALAETYARCPSFYDGTFCARCAKHLPLDEFVWEGTNIRVGS